MAESIGTFDRFYISADDSTYTSHEFLDGSGIGLNENFTHPNGIRGTRGKQAERTVRNIRGSNGQLQFNPTPADLDTLLPWILGTAESSDSFILDEGSLARYIRVSRDGTFHLYDGNKVQNAVFAASEGSLLQLTITCTGIDEATSSVPSGPPAIAEDQPYVFHEAVLSMASTTYAFGGFQLSIDNGIEVRHRNSITPSSIHACDRDVRISLTLPYGTASARYGSALAGIAVTLTFTNGNKSILFTLPAVQAPKEPIPLGGRRARDLPWNGIARRTGSTQELTVTNDSSA